MDNEGTPMRDLLNTLPQQGELVWIGVRPAPNESMVELSQAEVKIGEGLVEDRFKGRPDSKRPVTLIQQEHLSVISSLLHVDKMDPAALRRNLVVKSINLLALKNRTLSIGSVVLQATGLCHPCSKMEAILGRCSFKKSKNTRIFGEIRSRFK